MVDLKLIPTNPGCYLHKDSKGNVIYVGKAKNLKKRVSNYFQKKDYDSKTQQLVKYITETDFIVTDSEIEALILESNLIKKYNPKYNVNLKDSKHYSYILLTYEEFPRLIRARNKSQKGTYFGPFISSREQTYLIEFLSKTFKLRTCKKIPKKACLRYHIDLCEAPCIKKISKQDYGNKIKFVESILKGKTSNTINMLEKKMQKESENQNYENALDLRNKISALEYLKERQTMERAKKFDEDIFNYQIRDNKVFLISFNIYKGTLINKAEYSFDYIEGAFEDFIKQYYNHDKKIPKEIIIPHKIDYSIEKYLSKKKGSNVKLIIPKIGEKKKLLNLVKKNIELSFFANLKKLDQLKEKLKLPTIPYVIECFDISHISGTSTVASMVQFRNGKPNKSNYRRFKIKTIDGIDDFASIAEVVRRRYKRLLKEQKDMPDVIIIDGGKGQLSSAFNELKKIGLNIPIISIAKRDEELFVPGLSKPILLSKKESALQLVQEIRDEAHRFAINYNRLLRKKKMFE